MTSMPLPRRSTSVNLDDGARGRLAARPSLAEATATAYPEHLDHLVDTAGLVAMVPPSSSHSARPWQCLHRPAPLQTLQANNLKALLKSGAVDAFSAVAFDIDDTLICTEWRFTAAGARPGPETLTTRSVEPDTAAVVRRLQDIGIPVFGLTARSPALCGLDVPRNTRRQLHQVGIDLGRDSLLPRRARLSTRYPATCQDGIVFCGDNSKGRTLAELAAVLPLQRLVVVDDNLDHFEALAKWGPAVGLELTLVYYTAGLCARQVHLQRWRWWWFCLRAFFGVAGR